MADTALKEQPVWEEIIRQIETTDTVIGGEDGVPNIAPRQLANRTQYLKENKLDKTANAASATKLAQAITLALSGDVSGSITFDGSANKTITVTVKDDSHNHIIGNVDGLQSALDSKLGATSNAVSATKLKTARTITLAGDVSGSTTFDGSGNKTITVTVKDDSHTHKAENVVGLSDMLDDFVSALNLDGYAKETDLYPIGAPIPWPSDTLPETGEYAFMKGQAFDKNLYPELAKVFPDGVIDDMRGLAIVGKLDSETVRAYEADNIKSHNHSGSVSSTNLGTKYTNTTGNHNHLGGLHYYNYTSALFSYGSTTGSSSYAGASHGNYSTTLARRAYTNTTGNHKHSVSVGAHGHSVTINSTGAAKNTIRNRKFNFIVRMK